MGSTELDSTFFASASAGPAGPVVGPPRGTAIGRFLVVETLGSGGMGLVVAGYDPTLDRKVAIKLVRPDLASGEVRSPLAARLLREAQAMAKIAHPNVLAVHDVGEHEDQVYIAMEYIDGESLAHWLSTPRPVAQILSRFRAAGRGLAAAHALGLVHRDFKPSNVLCSRDGRVLVADFGVVALSGGSDDVSALPRSPIGGELTSDGAVIGTPGFMPPEQRAGKPVDARADQYAFCVALREALGSGAPRWLRPVLERGLAAEAERRHPSMSALVRALEHGPGPRLPLPLAAAASALVVAAAVAVPLVARGPAAPAPCTGFEARLAGVWDPEVKAAVRRAFLATGVPNAEVAFDGASARLERYAGAWLAMREDACEATAVRREQSATILDLRMDCLDDRLRELGTLAAAFGSATAATVGRAVPAATAMTPLTDCAAPGFLASLPRLPSDPVKQGEALALRPIVTTVRILTRLGRYPQARELARGALASARDSGYPVVLSELLTLGGRVSQILGDFAAARALLEEAVNVTDRARDDHGRARAMAELIFAYGWGEHDHARAHQLARQVESVLARVGGDKLTQLAVAGYEADIYDEERDRQASLPLRREAARLAREVFGAGSYPEAVHLAGLASTLEGLGERREAQLVGAQAFAIMVATVGHDHPNVARHLLSMGAVRTHAGDFHGALAVFREALGIQERSASWNPDISATLTNIGEAMMDLGDFEGAGPYFERGLAAAERGYGPQSPFAGNALHGLGRVEQRRGNTAKAIALLERALAVRVAAKASEADIAATRKELDRARGQITARSR